jgi:hypothetical protein
MFFERSLELQSELIGFDALFQTGGGFDATRGVGRVSGRTGSNTEKKLEPN